MADFELTTEFTATSFQMSCLVDVEKFSSCLEELEKGQLQVVQE